MRTEPIPFAEQMNAADAVMWDIEKDPVLRSTITALAVLDRSPDWDRLVERVDRASRLIPRLRQRVVVPPLRIGPPRWVVDPDFDLDYHLRRVRLPEPGTERQLLDFAQPIAMQSFDRARPLWEFTLVEGLEGGRAALVQKLHHSLTDGVGGIELALLLLDGQRDEGELPPMPPLPAPDQTAPRDVLAAAVAGRGREAVGAARALPLDVGRTVLRTLADPVGSVQRAGELGRSLGKLLAPVPESASPIMRGRSLSRRFDTIDVPLADLKEAGHAARGTVNDAFLAAVVGGLQRYHQRHGVVVDELRLTMPINLRRADDALGGNHFAPARFAVPARIDDPRERMRRLGGIARGWQNEPALAFTETLAFVLDRLPVTVTTEFFGSMLKHIDAVVTNVPGVPSTSYLAGAELQREYAFAPPSGAAVNVGLLSHVDTACVGIVSDTAAVPDGDVLVACLLEGFDEVLGVVGRKVPRGPVAGGGVR